MFKPGTPGMVDTDASPRNYATGMWAYILQRATGLALVLYLLLHIVIVTQSIRGPDVFDALLRTLLGPPFLVLDLLLFAATLFHALNGVRIILFDLGIGIREQKTVFGALMAVGGVLFSWVFLRILPVLRARLG